MARATAAIGGTRHRSALSRPPAIAVTADRGALAHPSVFAAQGKNLTLMQADASGCTQIRCVPHRSPAPGHDMGYWR